MPDKAERVRDDGSTEEVSVTNLLEGDLVLSRLGPMPADGEVMEVCFDHRTADNTNALAAKC